MHPFTFRSEDDHRYWLSDPTPSLGPLYPGPHYNTYHGAPTASGAKQPHPRAPLNQLSEAFKPIRFTEEYANAAPSNAKSQQQQQQQRQQRQQQQRGGRTRQLSSTASNEGLAGGDDQVRGG